MRSDGRLRTRITHHDGLDANPVFSPDGRWLMWTSQRSADGTGQIYVARFHRPRGM
jgi:Tol biopolymer transport system component